MEIENISGSMAKVLYSSFLLHANLRAIEIKWKQAAHQLHLPYMKLSQKKLALELVSLTHFLHHFGRKKISFVISY